MDDKNTHNRNLYWSKVRQFTFVLIALWFSSTFGIIFFARELTDFTVFGWPFSFYMAAQGLTLLYLAILAIYALHMRKLDKLLNSETADVQ
jgi:putative solute:sodium symporter small subunit